MLEVPDSFGGHWRFVSRVWNIDLFWIWPLVFDAPIFQILALYLYTEGEKDIHVL